MLICLNVDVLKSINQKIFHLCSNQCIHQKLKMSLFEKTLLCTNSCCSHGCRQRGSVPPWIFIFGTDKVEGGLMVLFFGLVFSVDLSPPWKIFC